MGLVAVNLMQLVPKSAVLCEITRNESHWAVQGHSRSQILGLYILYLMSHRIRVIFACWSNYRFC